MFDFGRHKVKSEVAHIESEYLSELFAEKILFRISELLDLKKEDVHLEEQWFSVRHSKTEAGVRAVPIADKVLPFWQSFMDKSKSPYAVCTERGQKLSYDNFVKVYWKSLMNELNMKYTPHEMRYTFISLMVAANANQTIL